MIFFTRVLVSLLLLGTERYTAFVGISQHLSLTRGNPV